MCDFFSFVERADAQRYYFSWEQRNKEIKNPSGQIVDDYDSHSQICAYYNLDVDKVNKYEFNPITKIFTIDRINTKDHSKSAEKWVNKLDFKTIIEPLIIKPLIDIKKAPITVTDREIELLKVWEPLRASLREPVWASLMEPVWDSVWDSVWASLREPVMEPVWASLREPVWASLREPVWDSVWDSVRESIIQSVWDSAWAYTSSFFKVKRWEGFEELSDYENPFQSAIDLIDSGLIPSFDGSVSRLHAINTGEIVYEETKRCVIFSVLLKEQMHRDITSAGNRGIKRLKTPVAK